MQGPYIGRAIATVVIVGLVAWTAVRALGTRSPETPRTPFPAPATDAPLAIAKSQQFLPEAAFGASRPSLNISRELLW